MKKENTIYLFSNNFKLKQTENGEYKFVAVKVNEYKNTSYGDLKFTESDIRLMLKNFNNDVVGRMIDVYESDDHTTSDVEKITRAFVSNAKIIKDELVFYFKPIDKESNKILLKGKYQYISPEIQLNYKDKSGMIVGYTITSVLLTNNPFQKDLTPAYLLKNNEATSDNINNFNKKKRKVKKSMAEKGKSMLALKAETLNLKKEIELKDKEILNLKSDHKKEIEKLNLKIQEKDDLLLKSEQETFEKEVENFKTKHIQRGAITEAFWLKVTENGFDKDYFEKLKPGIESMPNECLMKLKSGATSYESPGEKKETAQDLVNEAKKKMPHKYKK